MRTSQLYFPTLKEVPADAELISHQLMLRAGMIRKLAAGIYTWLPLGLRVLRKVEQVIREELEKFGCMEVLMPTIQPAQLWHETGRWDKYGDNLLRMRDRHQRDFCYGPTHEEVITDLVRHELRSYKQLPLTLYQIQSKFRDETRPRFGLMRGREFMMKDAYSFHIDHASLKATYDDMYTAYSRIFARLGLDFRAVLADNGDIGGQESIEFQVLAQAGEDVIAYSDQGDYAANLEMATAAVPSKRSAPGAAMTEVATPDCRTIDSVCAYLDIPPQQSVKTLIVEGAESPLVALILRGDHELNPIQAGKHPLIKNPLSFADENLIAQQLGAPVGSLGPVGLTIPVIVDNDAAMLANFVCGANKKEVHFTQVNWLRDCPIEETAALRFVVAGDDSPDGKGKLQLTRGIEVGQIFQLGDTYSKKMQATVLNEQGKAVPMQMGCYGIGVSRTVAAAIEQHHDKYGIIWPEPMAPFQIALVPINLKKSQRLQAACETLYGELIAAGYEVLFDDRHERSGVLFSDMDLLGIPHRLVLSDRGIDADTVEYKARRSDEIQHIAMTELSAFLKETVKS